MRSWFGFMMLAATMVAAPAFAQTDDGPTGMWKGTVQRDGVQAPMEVRLAQKGGLWKGRADVNGASSPISAVQVNGNRVRFKVKGQGTFDGTVSKDSLNGSVSGTKKSKTPGSFTLARQQMSNEELQDQIDAVVESEGS
jgi:hypothetical protein